MDFEQAAVISVYVLTDCFRLVRKLAKSDC